MSIFSWLKGKAATPAEAKPAAPAPAAPPPETPPPETPPPVAPAPMPEATAAMPADAAGTAPAPAEAEPVTAAPEAPLAEPGAEAAAAPVADARAEAPAAAPGAEPHTEAAAAAPADTATEAASSPEPAAVTAETEAVAPEAADIAEPLAAAEPAPDAMPAAEAEAGVEADAEPLPETPVAAILAAAPEPEAAPSFSLLAAVDQAMAEPSSWPEDPIPEPPRPNDTLEARLTLARHGQPALELPVSAELLGSIIDNLPDHQSLEELYDLAAEHPSAQVRLAVARKDRLGEEAVRRLSEAREFYVLERLLASDQFRAQVSQERLIAILDLHPELARDVAGSYASYLNCAAGALLAYLGGHRDPGVRLALVENYSANAALLRRFAADPDPGVRAAAKRRLTEA